MIGNVYWGLAVTFLVAAVLLTPFGYLEGDILALAGIGFAVLGRN